MNLAWVHFSNRLPLLSDPLISGHAWYLICKQWFRRTQRVENKVEIRYIELYIPNLPSCQILILSVFMTIYTLYSLSLPAKCFCCCKSQEEMEDDYNAYLPLLFHMKHCMDLEGGTWQVYQVLWSSNTWQHHQVYPDRESEDHFFEKVTYLCIHSHL